MFEFLDFLSANFEVIVFCSGSEAYCGAILDAIETDKRYFAHRVYNDLALFQNAAFSVKYYDFIMCGERSRDNTFILESEVGAYCLNMFNGVPIAPYKGESGEEGEDSELAYVAKYLESVKDVASVYATIGSSIRDIVLEELNTEEKEYAEGDRKEYL